MKHLFMLAGAAALGFAGPALAHPGHGQGNGHGYAYGYNQGHGSEAEDQGDDQGVDQDYDADGNEGIGQGVGYGVGGCPPGLAKKTPACIPPGLARQQAITGQGVPMGYANPYGYGAVPYNPYVQNNPYYSPYRNAYPYQYSPRAMILQQLIGALVR